MTEPAWPRVLILPGLYNAGPGHWQSRWQTLHPAFERVVQRDWHSPDRNEWVATLDAAIHASNEPVVLVAHSNACSLVAFWAHQHRGPVRGALLVSPADTEAATYPPEPRGFQPMPREPLPFPSIVVASSDDPYVSPARAQAFAASWGSRYVGIGARGHINHDSGLGDWPEGLALLHEPALMD